MAAPQIALSALDASWTGATWPPEAAASSSGLGVQLEGIVVGAARRLECRRADVQKGFLASKKTADLNARYTEVQIRVDDRRKVDELKKNCASGTFLAQVVGGEAGFFPKPDGMFVHVASRQLVSRTAFSVALDRISSDCLEICIASFSARGFKSIRCRLSDSDCLVDSCDLQSRPHSLDIRHVV